MHKTPAQILASVKHAIRNGYAWPGGYPLYIVMSDGEALSLKAAREEWAQICRDTIDAAKYGNGGWAVAGAYINWEDDNLYCCHHSTKIECAYPQD